MKGQTFVWRYERCEIEHLLYDNEDMAQLYLTRKWIQNQQSEALMGEMAANGIFSTVPLLRQLYKKWCFGKQLSK